MIMEEDFQQRVLTVINHEDGKGNKLRTRVTIAPSCVTFFLASEEPFSEVNGQDVHKVNIFFHDGNQLELYVTPLDLTLLESAIGSYYRPM